VTQAGDAELELRRRVSRDGGVRDLTPETAIEAMVAFYRDVRAEDCDLEADGDMLLAQWGMSKDGHGERFVFEIIRQLITGDGEDRTVETVAAWMRSRLRDSWEASWQRQIAEIRQVWERAGDPAYGVYVRGLFRPLDEELVAAGLVCRPRLPGTLDGSEERWGPPEHRERRMWSVLREADGAELGSLVTRFFHDHTRLRIPEAPSVVALPLTDANRIRAAVLSGL
jgi:Family of unknown function (DUF6022)